MDFGAAFILDETEEEIPPSTGHESDEEMDESASGNDASGFECEVMRWEDDEENTEPPVSQRTEKASLNTVSLKMSSLLEKPDKSVNLKPVMCKNDSCHAAFSHINKIEEKDGKQVWTCKFCEVENEAAEELPSLQNSESDVMYTEIDDENNLPCVLSASSDEKKDIEVIFVMDISGSMCQPVTDLDVDSDSVLSEIMRREGEQELQEMRMMLGDPNFVMPRHPPTRLQAVKAAVVKQIKDLEQNHPSAKVGLVTFCDYVTVFGDGTGSNETIVIGNDLESTPNLDFIGSQNRVMQPVRITAEKLISKILTSTDNGQTALGPALYIALGMARREQGSKIILCTDGIANVGLGKIEESTSEEIDEFYQKVIEYGKTKAVSISILCCGEAKLDTKLGDVPSETGGWVEFLDPNTKDLTRLGAVIDEEVKRPIIAIHGCIKFMVHKSLFVQDRKDKDSRKNYYSHQIGNILKDRTVPFTFAFKESNSTQNPADSGPSSASGSDNTVQQGTHQWTTRKCGATTAENMGDTKPETIPFQVQVEFTDMNDRTACRIWTSERQKTTSRSQVENSVTPAGVDSFIQTSAEELLVEKITPKSTAQKILRESTKFENKGTAEQRKRLCAFGELVRQVICSDKSLNDKQIGQLHQYKDGRSSAATG